jgi:CHAT domain-containing protein/Flp pilus assembly protein TadD
MSLHLRSIVCAFLLCTLAASSNLMPMAVLPMLAQTGETRQSTADRLLEQGIQEWQTGQVAAALQSLQQALNLYRELNNAPKQVKTLRNLGTVYYLRSEPDQAIDYYRQSLNLARQLQDREGEAGALGNLGVVAAGQGDYRKATTYYQQALPIYRQINDRLGEGQTLGNLAEVEMGNGNYPQAIAYAQQTLQIARSLKDVRLEANTTGLLGVIYYSLSEYPKAIEFSQQQLELARQISDRRGEAAALNNLGNVYLAVGEYGQAIALLEQRIQLARTIQDRLGEAQSLKNLSSVYYNIGRYSQATELAFDSLAIAQAIQNQPLEASIYSSLGNLYYVAQDYAKALDYHQKHLQIDQVLNDLEGVGTALINLGNTYKAMGNLTQAIATHEQALAIGRKIGSRNQESTALLNLGVEYDTIGDYNKAIAYHQQALSLTRAIQDLPAQGIVLNNLGNTLFKSGQFAAAEQTLRSGLQVWEALRANLGRNDTNQIAIFEQQVRTYRLLQRVLVAQAKPNVALEIAERGRARAFVELLAQRTAGTDRTRSFAGATSSPTIAQMQQIAKAQNATLVQYSVTYEDVLINGKETAREAELYIWAIAPTGTVTFRQVDLKALGQQATPLSDLVAHSRVGMGVPGRGIQVIANPDVLDRNVSRLQQLYQVLIQPIADVLPQDPQARVTFIPQGALFLVPFAALQSPDGKYLIEQHTILSAPAIQVLEFTQQQRQQQRQRPSAPQVLVVGNPTMPKVPVAFGQPPEQLSPLPGAEQEAKAVAALLGTQPVLGAKATKVAIVAQLPQQRIIHLATHGLLDNISGFSDRFRSLGVPGAIALAPAGNDNGLLTVDEILNFKLNAELVVLSACDTGRGRITGDGVIGLSRSFVSAGVPSIIVSLWSIPDAPTATLMTEFYRTLQTHPDKAQALRQAMLAMMQRYPDPRDWAAFTLIGAAD